MPGPNAALEWELERVDWAAARIQAGTAAHVPDALRALATAETEEEAHRAYWRLDNSVVVQGCLYGAAEHVVAPLFHILCGGGMVARRRALDLLVELVGPAACESPADPGSWAGLLEDCRARAREGLAVLYWLLGADDAETRKWSITVLECVEREDSRLLWMLWRASETDPDAGVRDQASEVVTERCPPGPLVVGVLGARSSSSVGGTASAASEPAGQWPSAYGGSWVAFAEAASARMTAEDAALVRRLRADEGWVWRDVARRCAEAWGADWADDPIAGRLLCEVAAARLGEDAYVGPWA